MFVTRFAPSPTGYLHLGHAYSAFFAEKAARAAKGRFLLRIEDIDRARCRPAFEQAITEDLQWLGLFGDGDLFRQSDHMPDYAAALDTLKEQGVLYPCFCSRKDIAAASQAPHEAEIAPYPGLCRSLDRREATRRIAAGMAHAWRLDSGKALKRTGPLSFFDHARGKADVNPHILGDIVLGRKDALASYHLCVVIDDARQGVTLVTRGEDLYEATSTQRLIQALLDLPEPSYHHHPLLKGEDGQRLSKRDGALSLRTLRQLGYDPEKIKAMTGLLGAGFSD